MNPQWDSQALLEPITAGLPCGESLEDTALLASFGAFRVFGQSSALDPQPDWLKLKERCLEALARSKDLRVLAHLGSAVIRTDGIAAFSDTVEIASRWLESYWSETYPGVAEDTVLRRNALNCFADPVAIVDALRRAPIVTSRLHGTFSLRDIEMATGQLQPREGEARPDESQIDAAFDARPVGELAGLHGSVSRAAAAIRNIETLMREVDGSEGAPALDRLSAQFARLDRVLEGRLAGRGVEVSTGGTEGTAESPGAKGPAGGPIRSRQDAVRALDAVAEFFRQTEPSSPVPLFLERAKRLVSKDFLEVLADIAPDAVPQARAAGGLKDGY